jgi:alpha-glucosidase
MKRKIQIFAILSVICIPLLSAGRESPFTRKGSGPRYWIAYEYCYTTNSHIPESVWKENIDWMASEMLPYGYDMVCNDGWIEAAQTIDRNGYITKYNSDYQKGFAEWAEYIEDKGMRMGVYYNPMWMTAAAFQADVPVAGTSVTARSIAGEHSFNDYLHWVDVAKPGAKEWIQGYVKYFKDMGVGFLRIDFLENYERNYGTEAYRQALKWIDEAAGDDMMLSLVMPNCYDNASSELPYGDMIRIDDDCFDGDWEFVSGRRRGERKESWPQFGNAFDGFVAFSPLGGHGKMILDGDFMRMNRLASDNERRFLISLMIMAGSPLAIADQYSTIRQHAWVYQNREMLELNDLGFVGKPLSSDPLDAENSSRWVGQLPCGDWVVGLFNREESEKTMGVDFLRELGVDPKEIENIRDLWQNRDMDIPARRWSVELAPHECQILRIKTGGKLRIEAEFATLLEGVKTNE